MTQATIFRHQLLGLEQFSQSDLRRLFYRTDLRQRQSSTRFEYTEREKFSSLSVRVLKAKRRGNVHKNNFTIVSNKLVAIYQ